MATTTSAHAVSLTLACGRTATFEMPETLDPEREAIFVLGVRKSGSTLLNRLAIAFAKRYKLPFVDIGGGFFSQDLKVAQWVNDPVVAELFKPGYMYGGFRATYDHFLPSPAFQNARKILLVRDPRDALVSQYFSTIKTHSVPAATQGEGGAAAQLLKQRAEASTMTIDDYVIMNARAFKRTLEGYLPLLGDPKLKLFRYEDVIQDKGPWIRKMLDGMGLPKHKDFIERMVVAHDIRPKTEDSTQFIRKVTPGDHAEKLKPVTIEALTLIFQDIGHQFGYKLK
jgi:hypothetical protein